MAGRRRAIPLVTVSLVAACVAWLASSPPSAAQDAARKGSASGTQREEGLAAWAQVHSVLTHPRCINCHTATYYPQQGEQRRRHFANVVRGAEGKGVPGLNCATCHQESNADSTGAPLGISRRFLSSCLWVRRL